MAWDYVECTECDEQFEWDWRGEVDVCPHCRSIDSLEEIDEPSPEHEYSEADLKADYLYEQWKANRYE